MACCCSKAACIDACLTAADCCGGGAADTWRPLAMLAFKKIYFRRKNWQKIGRFFTQTTPSFCKKLDHNIGFEINASFSPKIMIITYICTYAAATFRSLYSAFLAEVFVETR
jgi:hypothetical protein